MFVSHCLISCTHYYSTCFTVLPAALVSLHQSSDSHACWHSLKKKGAFDCVLSHCPCSSNPSHTHTHTPHRSEEQSHSSIHRSFHRHELGMWSVPSENAGGRWESEAVRKRWGETSPAATSSPRLTTSYISNTHTHIPSCRLPHTNSLYSMSVRE